jgi:hypothetical protein
MTSPLLKTLGPADLAALLRRNENTIKVDARRRPETLPPRFEIPGTNRLMWLEADVIAWVDSLRHYREKPAQEPALSAKRGRGRPRKGLV